MTLVIDSGFNYDTDASAYIDAVEAADGQALETATRYAINDFVIGCKQDGIWSAIKASCILAGARTLAGCLVPLVGTAPTNNNFVSGDYNRKTGLVGNGSTKYLNSNRNNNSDPRDSQHVSVFQSSITNVTNQFLVSAGNDALGSTALQHTVANYAFRSRNNAETARVPGIFSNTFIAVSRSNANNYVRRVSGISSLASQSSQGANSRNIFVFASPNASSSPEIFSNARLSFYSIGESLDLAKLDGRVTDLMNAFAAAIP